jgi:hypothetical protein
MVIMTGDVFGDRVGTANKEIHVNRKKQREVPLLSFLVLWCSNTSDALREVVRPTSFIRKGNKTSVRLLALS